MGKKPAPKKHLELGVISSLVFSILGALICAMLFNGEARTFGQLVSVAVGASIGNTEWWKSKPGGMHVSIMVMLLIATIFSAFRNQIIDFIRQIYSWRTSNLP